MDTGPAAESATSTKTVAVIGAGLTGLLAAHGLKKHGFRAVVFERDAGLEARPRDWSMLVHWARPVFESLLPGDVLAELPSALCNPYLGAGELEAAESLPCYSGTDGRLLFRSATPGARRVSRRALRRLLARHVDVRWGCALERLEVTADDGHVRLAFRRADGKDAGDVDGGGGGEEEEMAFRADFVLGADGSASAVRRLLLRSDDDARPRPSGYVMATGIARYGDEAQVRAVVETHPVAALMMGGGAVGGIGTLAVDDPHDLSTWTTFWVKIWRASSPRLRGAEALRFVRDRTSPLLGVFQSAIDWTADDSQVYIDEMKYWVPVPWDNHGGRVTLAGDAAHPMLIYRGQGLQHAIVDVQRYVAGLVRLRASGGDEERSAVMGAYDDELVARGAAAVRQSLDEADKSLTVDAIRTMRMATQGHGQSA